MRKPGFILVIVLCSLTLQAQVDYTKYVNTFIGTGGHGHTYPGATRPFGMVQLSPDTRIDQSWDGCGGYHYSDSLIYGFSHTHLSGTGVSDYGDILIMPVSGKVTPLELFGRNFWSTFSHQNEKASPGYYSVHLNQGSVDVELTTTMRTGFHKYTFTNRQAEASLVLDLVHRDKVLNGMVYKISSTRVAGYRQSEGWARNQVVFFVMEFSQPFEDAITFAGPAFESNEPVSGNATRVAFRFKNHGPVYVKVALSPVTIEGAIKNLETENPGWDFERVRREAHDHWLNELKKIQVSGGTESQKRIFYTALYHCLIVPNLAMDTDSMYRGRDDRSHRANGHGYYSVFSLWDTFRAWHPLMTVFQQKISIDFIRTFLEQYEQGGLLPVWELASNETECMIGYHAVSVIADAAVKGLKGFDYARALEAMKKSAMSGHRFGLDAYMKNGCIAVEDESESVSKTLEYAYDDWCISRMAEITRQKEDETYFRKRSQHWKNCFDPGSGFMRPKRNGNWYAPFDPREVNNHYTEANAWQYTFFVPHDIHGLMAKMGSAAAFENKLDEFFTTDSRTTGREQADITGLIGQYAHGNEPSHHIAYLYNALGKPWKSQKLILRIMNEMYTDAPDGLIGNEDCGQMSAWLVMSAMGFYPVVPGSTEFETGIPWFSSVKIMLENGKVFTVLRDSLPAKNQYLAAFIGGEKVPATTLDFKTIQDGQAISFKRMPVPDTAVVKPVRQSDTFISNPLIEAEEVFKGSTRVTLRSDNSGTKMFYSLFPGDSVLFNVYNTPFIVDNSVTIRAYAEDESGNRSYISKAVLHRMPHPEWKIELKTEYKPEYHAGGPMALLDGIRGDKNWRKGYWQGFWGKDLEVILDLGNSISVDSVSAGFLQDTRAWILMPKKMMVSCSDDGIHFRDTITIENTVPATDLNEQVKEFIIRFGKPVQARYLKIYAEHYGKLPAWHMGAGGDAYIFIDEIVVR